MKARVCSLLSPREFGGGQSGTGTGFSPSTSGFPRQHHIYFHLHIAPTRTNGRSLGQSDSSSQHISTAPQSGQTPVRQINAPYINESKKETQPFNRFIVVTSRILEFYNIYNTRSWTDSAHTHNFLLYSLTLYTLKMVAEGYRNM